MGNNENGKPSSQSLSSEWKACMFNLSASNRF